MSCIWIIFHAFLSSAVVVFYKINIFEKFFQDYHQSIGPDLGSNCLEKLSADDTSRLKSFVLFGIYRVTMFEMASAATFGGILRVKFLLA